MNLQQDIKRMIQMATDTITLDWGPPSSSPRFAHKIKNLLSPRGTHPLIIFISYFSFFLNME